VKISNLRLERGPSGARAVASIAWEDCARPPMELFFETDGRGAGDLEPEPEAFLTACVLPAMRNGEQRVHVEGTVCPRLAAGAAAAVDLVRSWYGPPRRAVAIEASRGFRAILPPRPERAALFFTAGVDSLHLLQINRSYYPREHPDSFSDCLSIFGHLCPSDVASPWNDRALEVLSESAAEQEMTLLPIWTNLWQLEPDLGFVAAESLSSALSAPAHLFRRRWSGISFASGRDAGRLARRGAHPLLDPLFSSSALEVRHVGIRFSRLERLQAVASSDSLLQNLIVCLAFPSAPRVNCGECEKCVRTMTSLLAIGKLSGARLFPEREVRPERIRALSISEYNLDYWSDLLPLLGRLGRPDLAGAIEEKLEETRRAGRWHAGVGWKGRLRRLDRRFFGGGLLQLRRRTPRPAPARGTGEPERCERQAGVSSSDLPGQQASTQ
jgi:hypothetical protein